MLKKNTPHLCRPTPPPELWWLPTRPSTMTPNVRSRVGGRPPVRQNYRIPNVKKHISDSHIFTDILSMPSVLVLVQRESETIWFSRTLEAWDSLWIFNTRKRQPLPVMGSRGTQPLLLVPVFTMARWQKRHGHGIVFEDPRKIPKRCGNIRFRHSHRHKNHNHIAYNTCIINIEPQEIMIQFQPTTTKSTSFRSCALLSEYSIWITFKPLCLNVQQVHKHADSVYSAWATKEISEKGNINEPRTICGRSSNWLGVPTLFSIPDLVLPTSISGCSYLVLQRKYCMFGNRGTPQYYSSLHQIKAVTHHSYEILNEPRWLTYIHNVLTISHICCVAAVVPPPRFRVNGAPFAASQAARWLRKTPFSPP